jgi:ribosomal protein S18 acetylase RimI-like enzyme
MQQEFESNLGVQAVYEERSRVLGVALAWHIDTPVVQELQLLQLATRPEARRRGIAAALLAFLQRHERCAPRVP